MNQINQAEKNRVQSLLIDFKIPNTNQNLTPGQPNQKNQVIAKENYKTYPTPKNIPQSIKSSQQKRVLSIDLPGYQGEVLENGIKFGKGLLQFEDGQVQDGYFENDQFVKGRHIMPNGITFTGTFSNGNISGQGKFQSDLWSYEGDFADGKIQGKGKLIWRTPQNFEVSFSGQISDGSLQSGKLLITDANKEIVQSIEGLFGVSLNQKQLSDASLEDVEPPFEQEPQKSLSDQSVNLEQELWRLKQENQKQILDVQSTHDDALKDLKNKLALQNQQKIEFTALDLQQKIDQEIQVLSSEIQSQNDKTKENLVNQHYQEFKEALENLNKQEEFLKTFKNIMKVDDLDLQKTLLENKVMQAKKMLQELQSKPIQDASKVDQELQSLVEQKNQLQSQIDAIQIIELQVIEQQAAELRFDLEQRKTKFQQEMESIRDEKSKAVEDSKSQMDKSLQQIEQDYKITHKEDDDEQLNNLQSQIEELDARRKSFEQDCQQKVSKINKNTEELINKIVDATVVEQNLQGEIKLLQKDQDLKKIEQLQSDIAQMQSQINGLEDVIGTERNLDKQRINLQDKMESLAKKEAEFRKNIEQLKVQHIPDDQLAINDMEMKIQELKRQEPMVAQQLQDLQAHQIQFQMERDRDENSYSEKQASVDQRFVQIESLKQAVKREETKLDSLKRSTREQVRDLENQKKELESQQNSLIVIFVIATAISVLIGLLVSKFLYLKQNE